ncbi:hypothetical protein ACFL60_02780 [Candidatus Omnitrophota bacterium]
MKKKKKKPKKKIKRNKKKNTPLKKKRKPVKKIKKKKIVKAKKTSIPLDASLKEIGVVTHYFSHVEAAVIMLTKGSLSLGDTIVIKGHTTDFKEKVKSLQVDRVPITTASIGQEIGVKAKKKVREHDVVYKLIA